MTSKEKNMVPVLIPGLAIFIGFISPLIFYFISENKNDKEHARVLLNFELVVLIGLIVLSVISNFIPFFFFIPFGLSGIVWAGNAIICILAAVAANDGKSFKFPFTYEFIKK